MKLETTNEESKLDYKIVKKWQHKKESLDKCRLHFNSY